MRLYLMKLNGDKFGDLFFFSNSCQTNKAEEKLLNLNRECKDVNKQLKTLNNHVQDDRVKVEWKNH